MTPGKASLIPEYIEHIVSAINQIEKYCCRFDQAKFMDSDMVQDAVIRQFEIIGEAARRIISADPGFLKRYPDLELEAAYRMRNALAHGYETINLRTVWDTVQQKLPGLKSEAISVLKIYTRT